MLQRRTRAFTRLLAAATAALMGAALLTGPGAGTAGADSSSTQPVYAFSLNVAYTLGTNQAMSDVTKVLPYGQVGGLQEFSQAPDRTALANLLNSRNWSYYMPSGPQGSDPIIWDNSRYSLVPGSASSVKVHDAVFRDRTVMTTKSGYALDPLTNQPIYDPVTQRYTCVPGSVSNDAVVPNQCSDITVPVVTNHNVTPSRWINSVRLLDKQTGKILGFINTHAIAKGSFDAQYGGKDDFFDQDPSRLDGFNVPYLQSNIAQLAAAIQQMAGQTSSVIATGDLNVNFIADQRRQLDGYPTKVLGPFVNFDMPTDASAGGSLLDYVMSLKGGDLTRSNSWLMRGLNTDHPAVIVSYNTPSSLYAFTPGTIRSAPRARALAARRAVLDQFLLGLNKAPAGAWVGIQSRRINNGEVWGAINAARARGVRVNVKIKRRTGKSIMLVSQSGATSSLTMVTRTPLVGRMQRMRSAVVVRTDGGSWAANARIYNSRR